MKDTVVAAVEVSLLVAALAAAAPRGKARSAPSNPPVQAQYASFISMGAPTPAATPVASAAKAAPVPAPEPAAAPAPASALPAGAAQLWGVVDSVDASAHALAVKDKRGRLHSVALPADAQVTLGGENVAQSPKDLKPGDAVTVTTENGIARLVHKRLLFPAPGAGTQASN